MAIKIFSDSDIKKIHEIQHFIGGWVPWFNDHTGVFYRRTYYKLFPYWKLDDSVADSKESTALLS